MLASFVTADDTGLRKLNTGDEGRGWEAVGRLDIDGTGFCTGALIEEDLVLTAAHCLFDPTTGAQIDETEIEFRAGWRNGRASAYRWVGDAVVHPDYDYAAAAHEGRVRNDVALLKLVQPIRTTEVRPFATDMRPRDGERVGVVSYAHNRADVPSLQEMCRVMARQHGVLVMSCDVDFGSSGAPVFSFLDGEPRIVSVVSAKAEANGTPVSLGTALESPLQVLRVEMASRSRFQSSAERNATGAKFVKP
ncbi:trypsin-like serine peptidase [Primorskyibacter sp. S187A]|uniref:trypsin-like serine peptidase n=1 Tax=Primorskyibacter sp. S187A TaxID=3415130 RepID=UPI003C7DF1F0